jgi:hypothetical protein
MTSNYAYRRAAEIAAAKEFAALAGYGTYPAACAATLVVGQTAGLDTRGRTTGDPIPLEDAVGAVMRRRRGQVGREHAGANVVAATGFYGGEPEGAIRVCLDWFPTPRERTRRVFDRNVRRLAQGVADELSQREVLVEWRARGRFARTDGASPPGAPSPTDRERFCAWVRRHSRRARTDPTDPCYRSATGVDHRQGGS